MAYTKLHEGLVTSTIWREPHPTRIMWVTMMAMANKHGEVYASIPGLADMARVTLAECESALEAFLAPDRYSRTPDFEGRRIERISGGWSLLNHEKYRQLCSKEEEREATAERVARYRARKKTAGSTETLGNGQVAAGNARVTVGVDIAEAEAEAEATTDKISQATSKTTRKRSTAAPSLTVEALCVDGLAADLAAEYLAMRDRKRARLTARAWAGVAAEIRKAGLSLDAGIAKALARGWVGFEAAWVTPDATGRGVGVGVNRQEAQEARNRAVGEAWAEKMQAMENCDARG